MTGCGLLNLFFFDESNAEPIWIVPLLRLKLKTLNDKFKNNNETSI